MKSGEVSPPDVITLITYVIAAQIGNTLAAEHEIFVFVFLNSVTRITFNNRHCGTVHCSNDTDMICTSRPTCGINDYKVADLRVICA